jgi:hypothetical protein
VSYRRFRLAEFDLTPATVATIATVRTHTPKSVATVAAVADPAPRNQRIRSAYDRMLAACLYGAPEKHLRVVERFLDDHFDEARHLGWCDVALFGCYPDPAFATVRYDAMGVVTIAALTTQPITAVSESTIRLANDLAARRPASRNIARPVWFAFPRVANVHS